MRPLVLLALAPLLTLAWTPTSGASHEGELQLQWHEDVGQHGALWATLTGMQDQMQFSVHVPAQAEYAVGVVLLDEAARWRYEMHGEPWDMGDGRADLRVNRARTLDLDLLKASGVSTSLEGTSPCAGWFSTGMSQTPQERGHYFGFAYDEGCGITGAADLLVYVATPKGTPWRFEVRAPLPIQLDTVERTSSALHLAASDFATGTRASATLVADQVAVDAMAGDGGLTLFDAEKGFRGAFDGWDSSGPGLRATAGVGGTVYECPCVIRGGTPGSWRFTVEGAGIAWGSEMRVIGIDTSFPW